jgi:hypothetical protein
VCTNGTALCKELPTDDRPGYIHGKGCEWQCKEDLEVEPEPVPYKCGDLTTCHVCYQVRSWTYVAWHVCVCGLAARKGADVGRCPTIFLCFAVDNSVVYLGIDEMLNRGHNRGSVALGTKRRRMARRSASASWAHAPRVPHPALLPGANSSAQRLHFDRDGSYEQRICG